MVSEITHPPLESLRSGRIADNGVVNHSPSEQSHTVNCDTTKYKDMGLKKRRVGSWVLKWWWEQGRGGDLAGA